MQRRRLPLSRVLHCSQTNRLLHIATSTTRVHSNNAAVALSRFKGGGIWVQGDGSTPCPGNAEAGTGRILCFNQGVISFDSHKFHATEPWTGVTRILVGFTVKGFEALPPTQSRRCSRPTLHYPISGPPTSSTPHRVHRHFPYAWNCSLV